MPGREAGGDRGWPEKLAPDRCGVTHDGLTLPRFDPAAVHWILPRLAIRAESKQ